ncbi:MAG: tyrosine--tRNA ligase [Deltaproteobacteria bacterium]|nr:tyrosine--tRNA ligase [Deltaproteobacteria bacterium]
MAATTDILHELRQRGFVQQVSDEPALASLLSRGPITFYAGFDPTASSLHVGSMIPLMAMAHLARGGHRPIAVLGGGTAMVGDPSGRTELRQMMAVETIQQNRRAIEPQIRRFLLDAGEKAVVVDNADWLVPLPYLEFLRDIGRHFSVNRMLAAEAYRQRLEKGLSFIEFNYQILQAYDYLILHQRYGCALQVGGDDQWGNILAGTDLIRRRHQVETYALTFPLITTAAGAKMGKTAAGAVWLSGERTSPFDFYQYFVNVDDRDVGRFLKLLTFLPVDEIGRLAALEGAELRAAKHALAFEATALVHGKAAAETAQKAARAAFGGGGGELVPTHVVTGSDLAAGLKTVDLLAAAGLVNSKSAARRLVQQGGVRLGDRKVSTVEDVVRADEIAADGTLLYAGKKHVRRIVVDG